MSEDQMQGIPRWRPFRNLAGLAPDKNGEWVRYADASRALQKLRDALESVTQPWMEPVREGYVLWSDWKKAHTAWTEARAALREAKNE